MTQNCHSPYSLPQITQRFFVFLFSSYNYFIYLNCIFSCYKFSLIYILFWPLFSFILFSYRKSLSIVKHFSIFRFVLALSFCQVEWKQYITVYYHHIYDTPIIGLLFPILILLSPSDALYIWNITGPLTEPCCTPYFTSILHISVPHTFNPVRSDTNIPT